MPDVESEDAEVPKGATGRVHAEGSEGTGQLGRYDRGGEFLVVLAGQLRRVRLSTPRHVRREHQDFGQADGLGCRVQREGLSRISVPLSRKPCVQTAAD